MVETNPYDGVDLDAFRITPVGEISGMMVFQVHLSDHPAFDAVVFRDHLVRTLFNFTHDQWHLGNDHRFVKLPHNDPALALSARDAKRLGDYGWL